MDVVGLRLKIVPESGVRKWAPSPPSHLLLLTRESGNVSLSPPPPPVHVYKGDFEFWSISPTSPPPSPAPYFWSNPLASPTSSDTGLTL